MAKTKKQINITVVGLGYIGLPTACLLAKAGNAVYGYDIDDRKLALLKKRETPFQEQGLQKLLGQVIRTKRFTAGKSLQKSDVFLIAVPTPDVNHRADLTFVFQAIHAVIPYLEDDNLVIIESTIPPLACEQHIMPLLEKSGKKVLLSHCPERAIPGSTLREMVENDRIVGGLTPLAAQRTATLYKGFVKGQVYTTSATTAECCKVMENTFRDVNIALANEFAKISDEIGINVWEAIELANKHPRVNIHSPGPGVGGHCIPVDPWFFVGLSKEAKLIHAARTINDAMPAYVVQKVAEQAKKLKISKSVVGVLGVSYKKNVDDARETPATQIIKQLKKRGYRVLVHDPHVKRFSEKISPLKNVLSKSQLIVLVTDHDEYKTINFSKYKNIHRVFDTRNVLQNKKNETIIATLGVPQK